MSTDPATAPDVGVIPSPVEVDLSEVEAGTYRLVAHSWQQITSKPGQPFDFVVHRRGAEVELDVAEARRLVKAGAVVSTKPAKTPAASPAKSELEDPSAYPAKAIFAELERLKADATVVEAVLELERRGKNRSSVVKPLEAGLAKLKAADADAGGHQGDQGDPAAASDGDADSDGDGDGAGSGDAS